MTLANDGFTRGPMDGTVVNPWRTVARNDDVVNDMHAGCCDKTFRRTQHADIGAVG